MINALITGASSGIGLAITNKLIARNIHVYGIGRTFDTPVASELFTPIVCDLTDTKALSDCINRLRKSVSFSIVIHNAGVGYFGPHEEQSPGKIHEMTCINLEVPMLITNLLLRDLKKTCGTLIFISSVTAKKSNTHGCAYGATKAGLTSFAKSLFDEVRKYGVRVCVIHPDMTKSDFYRNADFETDDDEKAYLLPEDIAEAAYLIINARNGVVLNDITITPQFHRIKRKKD